MMLIKKFSFKTEHALHLGGKLCVEFTEGFYLLCVHFFGSTNSEEVKSMEIPVGDSPNFLSYSPDQLCQNLASALENVPAWNAAVVCKSWG
jgi:hypothetical protein